MSTFLLLFRAMFTRRRSRPVATITQLPFTMRGGAKPMIVTSAARACDSQWLRGSRRALQRKSTGLR